MTLMPRLTIAIAVVLACLATPLAAFTALPRKVASPISSLNLFGNLGDAFKNDAGLGKQENAGLKGVSVYLFACIILYLYVNVCTQLPPQGPKFNEGVTINGKPVKAVVGQKVSVVAAAARVKIAYNCNKGDCGTCMVNINGKKVKACQMTIPEGKCAIKTI